MSSDFHGPVESFLFRSNSPPIEPFFSSHFSLQEEDLLSSSTKAQQEIKKSSSLTCLGDQEFCFRNKELIGLWNSKNNFIYSDEYKHDWVGLQSNYLILTSKNTIRVIDRNTQESFLLSPIHAYIDQFWCLKVIEINQINFLVIFTVMQIARKQVLKTIQFTHSANIHLYQNLPKIFANNEFEQFPREHFYSVCQLSNINRGEYVSLSRDNKSLVLDFWDAELKHVDDLFLSSKVKQRLQIENANCQIELQTIAHYLLISHIAKQSFPPSNTLTKSYLLVMVNLLTMKVGEVLDFAELLPISKMVKEKRYEQYNWGKLQPFVHTCGSGHLHYMLALSQNFVHHHEEADIKLQRKTMSIMTLLDIFSGEIEQKGFKAKIESFYINNQKLTLVLSLPNDPRSLTINIPRFEYIRQICLQELFIKIFPFLKSKLPLDLIKITMEYLMLYSISFHGYASSNSKAEDRHSKIRRSSFALFDSPFKPPTENNAKLNNLIKLANKLVVSEGSAHFSI